MTTFLATMYSILQQVIISMCVCVSSILWLVKSDKVERRVSNSQQREQRVANPSQEKKAEETGASEEAAREISSSAKVGKCSYTIPPVDSERILLALSYQKVSAF